MSSTIPAAISALVTVIDTALGPSVQVHDGKPVSAETPDWVAVAYDPTAETAVEFDREWAQIGAQRLEEHYSILCTLRSGSGDERLVDRRAAAFTLLDAVTAAIAADYSLGGVVRTAAVLGSGQLDQAENRSGAAAGIRFRVQVEARINN
jgi:hypothetical protein